jgi:hypothetical protein
MDKWYQTTGKRPQLLNPIDRPPRVGDIGMVPSSEAVTSAAAVGERSHENATGIAMAAGRKIHCRIIDYSLGTYAPPTGLVGERPYWGSPIVSSNRPNLASE